jgi:o-succinylbenzoate synthase
MASIIIQSIHCYQFELVLAHPFFVRSEEIDRRSGFIVHVISDRGDIGFGEISPLPGVSAESFQKAEHQAKFLLRELKGSKAPLELPLLLEWFSKRLPESSICASVKFGFESAILSMVARINGKALCDFLKAGSKREVHSAGLLQGSMSDVVRQARFLHARGYKTYKLRVGNRNLPLDVQKVEEVRRIIAPDARIRLDANKSWRLDEARMFAQHVGKDRIEYIEEPLADPVQLEAFVYATDMPVALDETLQDVPLEDVAGRLGITHVVARPMQCGGIPGYLDLLERADHLGLQVVLTSAFESGVGMTVLANLAVLTHTVPNLGTANWFDQDLLLRPVVLDAGRIPVDRLAIETKFFHSIFAHQLQAT